jgi:hypothetical protein
VGVQKHRAGIVLFGAVVLFATTVASANSPDDYTIKLNARDQAAARAVSLHRADLAALKDLAGIGLEPAAKWENVPGEPTLSSDPATPQACRAKQSDLALTGAALSTFTNQQIGLAAVALSSQVQVLQSADMVRLDWQRQVMRPNLMACARQSLLRDLKGPNFKLRTFKRINYPRGMRYPYAYVATVDQRENGTRTAMAVELLVQFKGRTEVILTGSALSAKAEIAEAELILFIHKLAPVLVGRARA